MIAEKSFDKVELIRDMKVEPLKIESKKFSESHTNAMPSLTPDKLSVENK